MAVLGRCLGNSAFEDPYTLINGINTQHHQTLSSFLTTLIISTPQAPLPWLSLFKTKKLKEITGYPEKKSTGNKEEGRKKESHFSWNTIFPFLSLSHSAFQRYPNVPPHQPPFLHLKASINVNLQLLEREKGV